MTEIAPGQPGNVPDDGPIPDDWRTSVAASLAVDGLRAVFVENADAIAEFPADPALRAHLTDDLLRNIDSLHDLIRDMLQAFPDTADEQEWRDRAGTLGVADPDGQPYRAYTEDDL